MRHSGSDQQVEEGRQVSVGSAARPPLSRIDAFEQCWQGELRAAVAAWIAAGGPRADRSVVAAGAAGTRLAGVARGELEAAVLRHPLRARLWELLLVAAYLAEGRRAAAEVERRARAVFAEHLGVEPAGRICLVAEAVRLGRLTEDWLVDPAPAPVPDAVASPPVTRPRPAARLPVPLTALLGRDDLLDAVGQQLRAHRLVTLTGTGGAGKTRLAVAAAVRVSGRPVWFVDLTAVESPVRVPQAVAAALGVPDVGVDVVESLLADLGTAEALLVLDNCEHLVAGCAELVGRLLAHCPGLRVLATSRVGLRVPGESRIRVPALELPPGSTGHRIEALAAHPATRLFLERARQVCGRDVPEASADAVVRLCAELDGLPLAIELAAARTPLLSIDEIINRLRADVRLLRSPDPTAPDRHRSLAAAVESSLAQLDADTCRLFDRLSICVGGFDLDVARALGGPAAPAALAALVEASLVEPVPTVPVPVESASAVPVRAEPVRGESARAESARAESARAEPASAEPLRGGSASAEPTTVEPVRYRMLGPIRRHAAARLAASGAEPAARHTLATYCLELARCADSRLRGAGQERTLARLRAEAANLRSALTWLAEAGAAGPAYGDLRLAAALGTYWRLEGHYREGHAWLATALARHPGAPPALRARAGTGAAMLAMLRCDYPAAIRHAELARAACRTVGDRPGEARVEQILGSVAREQARYPESAAHLAAAGAIFAECGDEWGEAQILELRGFTAWLGGDLDRADSRLRASLRRYEALGDPLAAASALLNLGAVALYRGDVDRASALLDVALHRNSAMGFPEGVGWAHNLRGLVELRAGRTGRAAAHLRAGLAAHRQVGDRWRTASVLEALAEVARLEGDPGRAAMLLGAAERIRDEIGAPVPACERADVEATRRALGAALGDRYPDTCRWGRELGADALVSTGEGAPAGHAAG